MACVRKRRGKWTVDYRDAWKRRRWIVCRTKREADLLCAEKQRETRQATRPAVDPDITVARYADRWLMLIKASVKRRTAESYEQTLKLHILPALGDVKIRQLPKGRIKALLAEKLQHGKVKKITEGKITKEVRVPLARDSVRIIHATLRAMLNSAVDDGVILANPAEKLGRQLRLAAPPSARQEDIKAMTREQVESFLSTAAREGVPYHPLFLLLVRTGLRVGEAFALQWTDINFEDREIRVERGFSGGRIERPKAGHGRSVDMSQQLSRALQRLHIERATEKLRRGWPEMPPWVFCNEAGKPLDPSRVRKVFSRVLKAAKLPLHFHPHCLRHTFASLLLQQRESPAYVQRQLGHASIKLTVDTYGKWLPLGNKEAVDRLDSGPGTKPPGSKMVAAQPRRSEGALQVTETIGEPCGIRTHDPLIKSQVLYLLS
jgi:integrase